MHGTFPGTITNLASQRCIVPFDANGLKVLENIKLGRRLNVKIKFDRSSPENRWWHALVGVVAEGIGKDPEVLKLELKHHCHLWEAVYTSPVIGTVYVYKSVAFDAMDEVEFRVFAQESVEKIFTLYLDRVPRENVYRRVLELTGDRYPW